MLEGRRRITGLAALSLTAVGAVAGMEGTAFPTTKEPRPAAVGGGWLDDGLGQRAVHFALNARSGEAADFGHLNIKLAGDAGAFWGDVTGFQIIGPETAAIEGVVRKASGAYAACDGQPFELTAQDGEDSGKGDHLRGECAGGPRFAGQVSQGDLRVEGGIISPEEPG